MRIFYYKIGYSSYEESGYVELIHAHSFTRQQITEMIAEAILDILKNRTEDDYYHSYQCFHSKVAKWLTENKGFKRIKYDQTWDVFGWGSVFVADDWAQDRDSELNRLTAIINKAGYGLKDDSFLSSEE